MKTILALLILCSAAALTQDAAPSQDNPPSQAAPPPAPTKIRVSGGVMQGRVAHKVLPKYPDEAMRKGIQGDVVFKITVDESGKIVANEPLEGDPLLQAATLDAMRDFTFKPFLLNGTPIQVETQLGFHFTATHQGDGVQGQVACMQKYPPR